MSLPMLLFPLRIVWKPSPSLFIFFPCILLFWLTYHDLLVKWEKKQKQQHLLLLRVSFPQNLILRVVRVSGRAGALSRQLSWDRQDAPTCGELDFLASTAAWHQWPCLGLSIRPLMKTALMNCRNYMHSSLDPWLSHVTVMYSIHQVCVSHSVASDSLQPHGP